MKASPLFRIARSNYVGVFGTLEIEDNAAAADGTFFFRSRTRFAQVTDGLSNTIMVGERGAKRGGSLWQGVINLANEPMARIVGIADHPPNHPDHHFDDFTSYHPAGVHFLHRRRQRQPLQRLDRLRRLSGPLHDRRRRVGDAP